MVKLHKYQEYVRDFIISHKNCGILLDMGLGKTLCTLIAIHELMNVFCVIKKVLIIAPLSVANNTWTDEIDKWDSALNLTFTKVLGNRENRIKQLNTIKQIYIINQDNLVWLVDYYGSRWDFDLVVIDELSNFKNCKTMRFKALRKVRKNISRIIGLTGTPAPNSLLDLWSQMYLLDEGKSLGRFVTYFRNEYFKPLARKGDIVFSWGLKPGAEDKIFKRISSTCISMKAKDHLKLPKKVCNYIKVDLPNSKMKLYKQMAQEAYLKVKDKKIVALEAAVAVNKLMQMANGCVYSENKDPVIIHSEKIKALDNLIKKSPGKNILVFYNYKHDVEMIQAKLPKAKVLKGKDTKIVQQWNKGYIPILLAHPKSTAYGLNLQHGGHIIVWFSLTYSLELYEQANARLNRQGQKNTVIIHHIISRNTVDEKIIQSLSKKHDTQQTLLNALSVKI